MIQVFTDERMRMFRRRHVGLVMDKRRYDLERMVGRQRKIMEIMLPYTFKKKGFDKDGY